VADPKPPITDGDVMHGYCEAVVDMLVDQEFDKEKALSLMRERSIELSDLPELDLTDYDQEYLRCLLSGEPFDGSRFDD
jgi:hypothetical protein